MSEPIENNPHRVETTEEAGDRDDAAFYLHWARVDADAACRLLLRTLWETAPGTGSLFCGGKGAHSPHGRCPGIMPLWPCGDVEGEHQGHEVVRANGRRWFCPGTREPEADMNGPWYPHSP